MKPLAPTDPSRIQPIRILNPYLLDNAVTAKGATIETGLPPEEAQSLLPPDDAWIPLRTLQEHILWREREINITAYGTLRWLSVRGIDIPREDERVADSAKKLLRRALLLRDCWGNSAAHHICADRQYLQLIGPEFFTPETLLIENHYADTPADWAAEKGNLFLLSKDLLTPEVVFHRNVGNWTLIHHAADGRCIADIPHRYITPDNVFDTKPECWDNIRAVPEIRWDDIPWNSLEAYDWIRALPLLRNVEALHPSAALQGLINRCECLDRPEKTPALHEQAKP